MQKRTYIVETKVKLYGYVATFLLNHISCFILWTLVEGWNASIVKIYGYHLKDMDSMMIWETPITN